MSNPVLELDHLTKRYDGTAAVDDLSFAVAEGQVFGFLGHNGAGKTTTVQMLTTLTAPSSGTARVAGFDIVDQAMAVRQIIGYVPENVQLYANLTATENLMFFARLSGVANPAARVAEVLTYLDSADLGPRRVGTFSKGMRQRIGLAQAILHRPKVLFLDEPTSGLDPMGIKLLRDLILRLNRDAGMTIFMNTHLIGEIAQTCSSIAVLGHGRLIYHDQVAAVTARYGDAAAIEALYLSLTPQGTVTPLGNLTPQPAGAA